MTIECPECGYEWEEENWETHQRIMRANPGAPCVVLLKRVELKRQSHVEQTREVVEKRVR